MNHGIHGRWLHCLCALSAVLCWPATAQPNYRLTAGPMVGHVTESTATVWMSVGHSGGQILATRNQGELRRPMPHVRPIQLGAFSPYDAPHVLEISRTPSKELMEDEILSGRERYRLSPHLDVNGPRDRLGFIRGRRKNEINPDSRSAISRGKHEGVPNEVGSVLR